MVLIEIKKTIRKNPKAGNDRIIVAGTWEANFKLIGPIPKYLKDGDIAIISEGRGAKHSGDTIEKYWEGIILNPKIIDRLLKEKNCTVNQHREVQTHYHAPEAQWLYKYKKTKLKCSNCKSMVIHSDIICDYIGKDETYIEECPICKATDTFEDRKYQNINDVLK